ncbi:MAG: UDP-N-acetylmuramoyl-L-alanine--D-glutamate ligase [Halioglobus sp.]|nr:UDP-N-acetylmuramoyl-L-alanine--D-glutamate ligase [Halioglobus sp.]
MAAEIKENREQRVVVGLGFTGLSCARYLYQRGLHFSVIDTRAEPPALNELRDEMPDIEVFTGDYPPDVVSSAVELIVSPGIAIDAPIVLQAQAVGTDVVGDIDLFMREAAAPVIGITGSNAKSTVTELLGRMARDAKLSVGVGGNLGTPALDLLSSERDLYVLELSSFQLERSGRLGLTVATVLNVSADHMDRHRTMLVYQQAKHRIFRGCKTAVINRDDLLTIPTLSTGVEVVSWRMEEPESNGFGLRNEEGSEHLCFGSEALLAVSELRLVGRHNVANALAALALGHAAGLPLDSMRASLRTFVGLPHRCELIANIDGVSFVNDSKGTNVGATEAAVFGLGGDRNVLLIAGGQGKGADFSQLQQSVSRHCKLLIVLGEDASLLEQALSSCVALLSVYSLAEAVNAAASKAEAGDVVLLSPACASFDMFTGYGERGDTFRRLVNSLAGAVNG